MYKTLIALTGALLLVACGGQESAEESTTTVEPVAEAAPAILASGIALDNMDPEVRPQDDLYRHVSGIWLEETEIPSDRSNYGSFSKLADEAEINLRTIIEEAADTPAREEGSDMQKVGDLYISFMNEEIVEQLGLDPLRPELAKIDALVSHEDVIAYMGYAQKLGVRVPLGYWIENDFEDTEEYIVYLTQRGLGLPDRDYYFKEEEKFQETRAKYLEHMAKMLSLAGFENTEEAANSIMALETALAEVQWTRVQNRDRNATYNKFDVSGLGDLSPGFDWLAFLGSAHLSRQPLFIIRQPTYFDKLGEIVQATDVEDWQVYLRMRLLSWAAPFLSGAFVEENFDFHSRAIRGIEENRPRWKRGVALVEESLGEVLGQLYVDRHFQETSKVRMDEMVENLREAFRMSINELEWMGEDTKIEAQDKLASFVTKIGYPEKWKDYSALVVDADDLMANVMRSRQVEYQREVDKLGSPLDRGEWFMTPQSVNAYYNPNMNEIVFPAAILQPPFFNVEADDAVNYGGIGAVIGHEFSHGFDDQGRKTDGKGALRDWWTEEDAEEFQHRADGLVAQYSAYNPIDEEHVNGELTLGENIGDLAGLTMAYKAYKLSLNGEEAPVIDGFTGDQRFFMGWAQVWRRLYRDEELRRRVLTDPHSPSEYRANGIVTNMDIFYAAFDVKEGDALYKPPEERVRIW